MNSFIRRILDTLSPKACASCGIRLNAAEDFLCASCTLSLSRTDHADHPEDNQMGQLFWKILPLQRCAALMYYHRKADNSKIIYNLKYFNKPDIGVAAGRLVASEFLPKGFFEGIDLIVPVPLSVGRQRQRGYNQSMEIARGIAEVTGLKIENRAVMRQNFHGSQTKKDIWARTENVADAFKLIDAEKVRDRHILIVDDVVTTGATIRACGAVLAEAGNVKMSVLSLGFVKS